MFACEPIPTEGMHMCSGVTGGGSKCPPETTDQEIFTDLSGKDRQGKNGNWGKQEGKLKQNEVRTFFFLNLTKICFGSTKMEIFYRKNVFYARRNDFAPSEKFTCYAPARNEPDITLMSLPT